MPLRRDCLAGSRRRVQIVTDGTMPVPIWDVEHRRLKAGGVVAAVACVAHQHRCGGGWAVADLAHEVGWYVAICDQCG